MLSNRERSRWGIKERQCSTLSGAHVISPAVAGLAVMAVFVYIPSASDNGFGAWSLPTLC
jgi:hypothetical protein